MNKQTWLKIVITSLMVVAVVIWLYAFDGIQYFSLSGLSQFLNAIRSYGVLVPIIYVLIYWAVCLFFIPGTPITLVGGLLFGPIWGSIIISFASTTGATLAFLAGRTIGRDWVKNKFGDSNMFRKLDKGVRDNGWRMLMITRLVPLFPFNVQNYLYGLTDIKVGTYMLVSWLCMMPATIAYASLAGAIEKGDGDLGSMFLYLGIGAVIIVIMSFIPKFLKKKGYIENTEEVNDI